MKKHFGRFIAVLVSLNFGGTFAEDFYSGKTFRASGRWSGSELQVERVQLREVESDAKRGQLVAYIDALDHKTRTLTFGPLTLEWDDTTLFKNIKPEQLAVGLPLRVTVTAISKLRLLATSIQPPIGTIAKGTTQITGVASQIAIQPNGTKLLTLIGIPVVTRQAGYNAVDSLTQRQGTRRPDQPLSVELGGRPLTISGDYTLNYRERKNLKLDDTLRSNLDHEARVELLYPFRDDLYFFVEAKAFYENELRRTDGDPRTSARGIRRGQTWVFFDGLARRRLGVQIGRQNFKESREWWWDDDLDAARLYADEGPFHLEFALAKELARESSSEDDIDPRQKDVYRVIGQASWLWASRQAVEVFALHQNDRSTRDAVDSTVAANAADDSDASLTWLGLRVSGQRSTDDFGSYKYWADFGLVYGRETVFAFDDAGDGRSRVDSSKLRKVRGHGFDIGLSWQAPVRWQPSVSIGYAQGSGDDGSGGTDRGYRQTGLHNNKARFFGVNRFRYYGELLRPELSNLSVTTLALGVPFFNRSSVELVHHRYRQVRAADFMRDISVDDGLTGKSRNIGSEIDLVFGFRDLARWDFSLVASRFKAGSAYGSRAGNRANLLLFEATYNF